LFVPGLRIYLKFSFLLATDFLTPSEFPHGRNTMTKIQNEELPPEVGHLGSSFFFGLLPISIIGNMCCARQCGTKTLKK
jgi:hypothetical protein